MPETDMSVIKVADYSFRNLSGATQKKYMVTGANLKRPVIIYLGCLTTYSLEKSVEEILRDAAKNGELHRIIDETSKGLPMALPYKGAAPPQNTFSLIIRREDGEDEEHFFEFEVSRDFLAGYLQGESIEDFLNTYNSEDSQVVYEIALLNNAVLRETGCLEYGREQDNFPYRYVRIQNRAQLKKALSKGALIKFIRHHWRRRLDLFSEVVEVHGSYVSTKAFGYPHLLISQGAGLRFDIANASHYEFGDTIKWYNQPACEPRRGLIAEFYILRPI